MCDTPNRPVRNTTLLPTGHWGMAAFDSNMRHVKHIKHSKPCLGALMCYFGTNNPFLIYASCVTLPLLPTGHWGTTAVWAIEHIKHWKPSLGTWCVVSGQIIVSWYIHDVWYYLPASEEHTIAPNRPLRSGCICQHVMGHVKHIKLWKPSWWA